MMLLGCLRLSYWIGRWSASACVGTNLVLLFQIDPTSLLGVGYIGKITGYRNLWYILGNSYTCKYLLQFRWPLEIALRRGFPTPTVLKNSSTPPPIRTYVQFKLHHVSTPHILTVRCSFTWNIASLSIDPLITASSRAYSNHGWCAHTIPFRDTVPRTIPCNDSQSL